MISFLQIASLSNSIPEVYSELCQITRMKRFANIVHGVDYFRRTLQHRYLTGFWICVASFFHDGRHYHIETAALICKSNQWTGFYIIETSLMKELSCKDSDKKWFRNFTTSHSFTFTKRSYTFNTKVYVIL